MRIGNYYERNLSTSQVNACIYVGGQRIAVRRTTDSAGARQTELRYFAYGKTRYTYGAPPTSFKYTGQRQQANANEMYFYGARWYDALAGRFLSPDTIVPQPGNPQSLNRYIPITTLSATSILAGTIPSIRHGLKPSGRLMGARTQRIRIVI